MHTVLRPDVTQAVIDALRERINTIDPVSGEYHPDRALLEKELQTAEAILNDTGLSGTVRIHNGITTNRNLCASADTNRILSVQSVPRVLNVKCASALYSCGTADLKREEILPSQRYIFIIMTP